MQYRHGALPRESRPRNQYRSRKTRASAVQRNRRQARPQRLAPARRGPKCPVLPRDRSRTPPRARQRQRQPRQTHHPRRQRAQMQSRRGQARAQTSAPRLPRNLACRTQEAFRAHGWHPNQSGCCRRHCDRAWARARPRQAPPPARQWEPRH